MKEADLGVAQVIETAGAERLVIIPEAEYLRLLEAAEELEDIAAAADADSRLSDGRANYVDLDGRPVERANIASS